MGPRGAGHPLHPPGPGDLGHRTGLAAPCSPLTRRVLLLEAVNGGPLGFGLQQEQEHGFEDARHVTEGERPHQPALGRRADGAVCAGQAVQHDEQGPVCGTVPPVSVQCVCPRTSGLRPRWARGPRRTRTTGVQPRCMLQPAGELLTSTPEPWSSRLSMTVRAGLGHHELASEAACLAPHRGFWERGRGTF